MGYEARGSKRTPNFGQKDLYRVLTGRCLDSVTEGSTSLFKPIVHEEVDLDSDSIRSGIVAMATYVSEAISPHAPEARTYAAAIRGVRAASKHPLILRLQLQGLLEAIHLQHAFKGIRQKPT